MSFTNVAADEIKQKLKSVFASEVIMHYPHYLGTIDRFINTHIFLPHGHLILNAKRRPELIGPPHRSWTKGKGDKQYRTIPGRGRIIVNANPDGYFDITSFDINNRLYPLAASQEYHFSFKTENYYNKNGAVNQKIQNLIDSKWKNFELGYANQADANYIALKVLERFPLISSAIAQKFNYFIIDEAQDTDAIQMRIIELLKESGAKNIMLVGDPDQSIFEWNNADPALFEKKYEEWDKIELDENWRSTQQICDFTRPLSSFTRSFAVNTSLKSCSFEPVVKGYSKNDVQSMFPLLSKFFASCEENKIIVNRQNVAVLYRGKSMSQYLGFAIPRNDVHSSPWLAQNYHVKDIIQGKSLFEAGDFNTGYHLLEKGFFEAIHKKNDINYHCRREFIAAYIHEQGFMGHRTAVFKFIDSLPSTENQSVCSWVEAANRRMNSQGLDIILRVNTANSNMLITKLFPNEIILKATESYYSGTIHSVKGKTFEAIFLMLDKKAGTHSNYSTMLISGPKPQEVEELRNVYVALTRPRQIVFLAVPSEDVQVWSRKMLNF